MKRKNGYPKMGGASGNGGEKRRRVTNKNSTQLLHWKKRKTNKRGRGVHVRDLVVA